MIKYLKNEKTSIVLILFGLVIILLAIITFLWKDLDFSFSNKVASDKWGQIGDFIGGIVGSIWALAGVILFYIALTEQRKDIKTNQEALSLQVQALNKQVEEFELQRKELESSRKVYEQQTKTIKLQQFESHFYSLLTVYLKIKDGLNSIDVNSDYFKTTYQALEFEYNDESNIIDHHKALNDRYDNLFNEQRGHLSHFFKSFYRLVKIIDSNPFLEEKEKIQYSKILRSQLTDFEQLIIQYNSYSQYGTKSRPLILKYNLLKHIPLFQKSQFSYFYYLDMDIRIVKFADLLSGFAIKNIKDSFDLNHERDQIVEKEGVFNTLLAIYFDNSIRIEVSCCADISLNHIKLTEEQFSNFIYNLLIERVVLTTYTAIEKVTIAKYTTNTDENKVFGFKIDISEDVVINLNFDN